VSDKTNKTPDPVQFVPETVRFDSLSPLDVVLLPSGELGVRVIYQQGGFILDRSGTVIHGVAGSTLVTLIGSIRFGGGT